VDVVRDVAERGCHGGLGNIRMVLRGQVKVGLACFG
jgi:hypothetical protein